MKTKPFLICTLFLLAAAFVQAANTWSITDFGATGDGKTLNTKAINRAIDSCHTHGGGTVLVPAGEFVSGTVFLKSNVTLYLEAGAVLRGSSNLADYQAGERHYGLLYAYNCKNISIKGEGTIDGNSDVFMDMNRMHNFVDFDKQYIRQGESYLDGSTDGPCFYVKRPGMMIVLMNCEQVELSGLKLINSPSWTVRLGECAYVCVQGITIRNNPFVPNSDGIHCTTSRNVTISDCNIVAGDDAIIVTGFGNEIDEHGRAENNMPISQLHGNRSGIAENIVVTNCVLSSRSAGIRVGYGDNSMRNCTFSNLVIYDSNRGIGLFVRDKGSIENMTFSNIVIHTRFYSGIWWGNGEAIHLSALAQKEGTEPGRIRGASFNAIRATAQTGILVYGSQESIIEDVSFSDLSLTIEPGPLTQAYGGNFDLRPANSTARSIFSHDIPGFYFCRVKGFKINNFDLKWNQVTDTFLTDGIFGEEFENLLISGFTGRQAHTGRGSAIHLENGKDATITHCRASEGTHVFLTHHNCGSTLRLDNNFAQAASIEFQPKKIK